MSSEEVKRAFGALASRFHQDFDLEGISFQRGIDSHMLMLGERQMLMLVEALRCMLDAYPGDADFRNAFVAAGASNIAGSNPRTEVASFLRDWLENRGEDSR